MGQTEKAQMYGELLNKHTRLSNQISEIKGQNIDLSKEQLKKIEQLKFEQIKVMNDINKLLS